MCLFKKPKLNPENKDAHYGLGIFTRHKAGLNWLRNLSGRLFRIDGDYAEANTYLGQVLASQDRWKDAIAAYRQALSNPLSHARLGAVSPGEGLDA